MRTAALVGQKTNSMTYRIACCAAVAAALIASGGIGSAQAQVAATVDIDVVGAMKEVTHWVSSCWSTWDAHQKTLVAQAIPRVAEDLLDLAAQKKAVATDIQVLINSDRPPEAGGMPVSETREPFVRKALSDSGQLNVIFGRLRDDIQEIDPGAFMHLGAGPDLMDVKEGYGTVTLEIGQFTSDLSELGSQRAEDVEGMKKMVQYLHDEANKLLVIAHNMGVPN
jgi:hypothetical protein